MMLVNQEDVNRKRCPGLSVQKFKSTCASSSTAVEKVAGLDGGGGVWLARIKANIVKGNCGKFIAPGLH